MGPAEATATPQSILSLPNPLRLSLPSRVSDPDGLLSEAGRRVVEEVLRRCPQEVVFALFRRLKEGDGRKRGGFVYRVAKALFNAWGLGGRKNGVLYVLALQNREHHLYVGPGLLKYLGPSAREYILDQGVPGLRRRDVDGAVASVARQLVWYLTWGRRLMAWGVWALIATAMGVPLLLLVKRKIQERDARQERAAKVRNAWARMPRGDGRTSSVQAPCVVCIEPLTTVAEDWTAELALERRGCLEVRPGAAAAAVRTLARLSPALQRRVTSFLGPTLHDFEEGLRRTFRPRASSHGLELLRCGHVMHEGCAERWLARSNTCPQCRAVDPRIVALAVLPAAFAAAQAQRHLYPGGFAAQVADVDNFIDMTHFVAEIVEQPSAPTYTHHSSSTDDDGWLNVLLSGGDDGGGGTTGSW
mmetsp:Transcript_107470/g.302422  ORF Transcript_107470/g.302422 Transcript_107470/m.302422 type:complete len:416 (+) Transcript_107470:90-1337(+)